MTNVGLLPQKSDIWWVFLLQGFAEIILGLMLVTEPGATIVISRRSSASTGSLRAYLDWCRSS